MAYIEPGKVELRAIDFPVLALGGRRCDHGVVLKVVSTNICGSDQHMVRGRTTAPSGLVLGHEITGEVIEAGRDVEFIKVGDLVSVPFNIACGRCRNCKEGKTGICLNVNPARPGAAYGYVDMGGWVGGQAEYVMVPYADFNLLRFPDRDQAMAKIKDLTCLSDIFPTGFHGAVTRRRRSRVGGLRRRCGAGRAGLCRLLPPARARRWSSSGTGSPNAWPRRPASAARRSTSPRHRLPTRSRPSSVRPEVDSAVDCVGFEARGHGHDANHEVPAAVLNSLMEVTRAGGAIGIPGLYVTGDPGGIDEAAKLGNLSIRIGLGWAKSHAFVTGQCPVMRYHRQLMMAILHDKVQIAKAVNVEVIPLDEAPRGYRDFDQGAAKKFVLDPHGLIGVAS